MPKQTFARNAQVLAGGLHPAMKQAMAAQKRLNAPKPGIKAQMKAARSRYARGT